MNAKRIWRRDSARLLAVLTLVASAVQPALAEPAAAQGASPKNGAQHGVAAPHARWHRHGEAREGAKDAPGHANDLAAPPTRWLTHKPYVFPRPHNAMGLPLPMRHWPAGVPRGPARNAIGIAIERVAPVKMPTAPHVPLRAGAPGGLPKSAMTSAGALATDNGSGYRNASVRVPNPPHPLGISGTGITRVGAGPATIGGASRTTTGINGTSFRPKHGG